MDSRLILIKDEIHDAPNNVAQVEVGEYVNGMWGYRGITLSSSDIAHLLHGGCLYTDDGEYATVIALQRGAFNLNRDIKPDFTNHTGQGDYTN